MSSSAGTAPVNPAPPPQTANIDAQLPAGLLKNADRCDPLNASYCMFPFPNDYFTVADSTSQTGRRVHLNQQSMPRSQVVLDKPINPAPWNRNDGFSPGSPILLHIDNIDLKASGAPSIGDLPISVAPDSPIVIIDADTLQRWPCWAELDANASSPARQALIIRPARDFLDGHRYIVALRNLKDTSGKAIPAPVYFRIFRDNHASSIASINARRPHMESIFATLAKAGIPRKNLYLAWDFTVASEADLTDRLLHIRNDAFKSLGGKSPTFTIGKVTNYTKAQNAKILREVQGSVTVPSYMTIPDSEATLKPITDLLQTLVGTLGSLTPSQLQSALSQLQSLFTLVGDQDLPLPRYDYGLTNTATHPDALPQRGPGNATMSSAFTCIIPRSAVNADGTVNPARISLYGHGLFGSRNEVTAGNVEDMANEHDFVFCATNWYGFSQGDIPNALLTLLDVSNAPSLFDTTQQGILNFLFLGRAMLSPQGFTTQSAFQLGSPASSVLNTKALYYDGNSQGGILGGALMSVEQDIHRGVLGVPGMNYSLLLQRSVDFSTYAPFLYAAYPDTLDQQFVFALLQMLWDRAEADGYAQHMTSDPLPDTPPHKVLMHVAFGDHQVSMWSAEIEARTIGAKLHCPALEPGRDPDKVPFYDLQCIPADQASGYDGSAMVMWDSGPSKVDPPPQTNTPPSKGHDPHEDPRNTPAARVQKSDFLAPGGKVVDVCGGKPCGSNGYQPP